ncbi:MAG: bifunctional adenosylcobinamide kinase/adenosylcobinamide-phosphate guanylyltransferase [Candidatus Omnitrophica bacterium]|nr:bifunctional adenosylcobinamide kinase/adenosylcobinamide-phosphate guanylyltransferase [Candidatus Omnitrophota bacterium]
MKRFIFILGGMRSGKSSYAVKLAKDLNKKTAFIATAIPFDSEMKNRIKSHRLSRPKDWKVVEEPKAVEKALPGLKNRYGLVLIDCLGLLVSNLLMSGMKEGQIKKKITRLLRAIEKGDSDIILVSNEVGSGLVPDNVLGRAFTDTLGLANQMMAKAADEVIFMQCGIPTWLKRKIKYEKI